MQILVSVGDSHHAGLEIEDMAKNAKSEEECIGIASAFHLFCELDGNGISGSMHLLEKTGVPEILLFKDMAFRMALVIGSERQAGHPNLKLIHSEFCEADEISESLSRQHFLERCKDRLDGNSTQEWEL